MAEARCNRCGNFNPRAYVRHDHCRCARETPGGHFNPRAYVRHDTSSAVNPSAS